jgi:hypothetical protein
MRPTKTTLVFLRSFAGALVVFSTMVAPAVMPQATTSLHGTVVDPNGAAVPAAQLTLENEARAFKTETRTGPDGAYEFSQLPPATYQLTVAAPGFKTIIESRVILQVSTPATLNVKLSISDVAESVTVNAAAATMVNTSDATLGNPFDSRQILTIPSEGRNPVELLSLQPGVTYVGNQVDTDADSRGGAVNGARSDQSNITVDGIDNNDQLLGKAFTGVLRIPADSLEEFRVTTTNSNADAGRSSGAQVTLVTKSGTNSFHGSAYEYNRSLIGAANDWFNKHAQLDNGLPNEPGKLIRNTFGAAVGGPVWKNRLFFFANFEGQRSRETVQVVQPVPSANLRQGIVSYLCDAVTDPGCSTANSAVQVTAAPGVDPTQQLLVTLQPSQISAMDQTCISNGTCPGGNGVSSSILNVWNGKASLPNGKAIPAYPLPNTSAVAGADGYNILGYTFAAPQPTDQNTYLVRLDYNLTQNANHRLFLRGDLQNDRTLYAPQFPGEDPSKVTHDNSKGVFAGYTAVLGSTLINNARYGFIRQGVGTDGQNPYSQVSFWNLADQVSFQRTINVNVPVHQFADDLTWSGRKHTLQFGANWRIVNNNRFSNEQNFLFGSPHPTYLGPNGTVAGSGNDLDPSILSNPGAPLTGYPLVAGTSADSVAPDFGGSYDAAIVDVTGVLGSISATYNQTKAGFLPAGALVPRHFKANEVEFYAQDSWRMRPNLTITYGLRYTLLQPPYETAGNQVSPVPDLGAFYNARAVAMAAGQTYAPELNFDLSGQANGKQPYWNWDYGDVAPRFAFAYAPSGGGHGLLHALFGGPGKTSIRGGYGIYYDHFGQGVVNSFDRQGALGLTTYLANPSYVTTPQCAVRFVALTVIPTSNGCPVTSGGPPVPELPAPPSAGFPFVPPGAGANGSFAIGWGVDRGTKTPYAHAIDFGVTRELPGQFVLEVAYVGRLGHRLLQEVDMAQPLNIRDPKSGETYYQAASQLAKMAAAGTPISKVASIPYWEDLFPAAAGPGLFSCGATPCAPGPAPANPTATQNIYDLYYYEGINSISALQSLDTACFPACSTLGPYAYFDPQFSSLFGWRSIGHSYYHAMEVTLRRHFGSLQFDFNYTYSKSIDMNSNAERVNEYENGGGSAVAYSGQTINAWSPFAQRAPSDYDLTHQFNANWIYDLPFGRGRRFASDSNKLVDALVGGWQIAGLFRLTGGFPFSVSTYAFPTNYEQDSKSILIGAAPKTGTYTDSNGNPNVFLDGPAAADAFRYAYPGESGQRNNFRGPGFFDIDTSVSKQWTLHEGKTLRFSWETFNITNSVRFDVGSLNNYLFYAPSLGEFTQTLTKPRVMQFGLRFGF